MKICAEFDVMGNVGEDLVKMGDSRGEFGENRRSVRTTEKQGA
jgi:hypothetical protein